ncbi:MAG: sodium-dependent transporter, partial [bacterium]|nr:sodium-dependent transporter [bacterium]
GAGWGLFLTYAAHMRRSEPVTRNALFTGIGNNTVSLLAGMMVFGTLFAILQQQGGMSRPEVLDIARDSGPASTGLTLIWMPQLFAEMDLGKPLAVMFFGGLTLAGFTSLIAHLELEFRVLVDFGWSRAKAVAVALGAGYLLGLPSALNLDILSNQDFVWGVALILAGAFVAFAILRYGATRLAGEELGPTRLGPAWILTLRFFIPAGAAALLLWWLWLSADWNATLNCLLQWAGVGVILLLGNRFLLPKAVQHPVNGADDDAATGDSG